MTRRRQRRGRQSQPQRNKNSTGSSRPMEWQEYLRQFHPVGEEDLRLLTASCRRRRFPKGTLLTVPGQIQSELYFVTQGVQYSYFEAAHKRHVMAFTYPPQCCAIPDSFSF